MRRRHGTTGPQEQPSSRSWPTSTQLMDKLRDPARRRSTTFDAGGDPRSPRGDPPAGGSHGSDGAGARSKRHRKPFDDGLRQAPPAARRRCATPTSWSTTCTSWRRTPKHATAADWLTRGWRPTRDALQTGQRKDGKSGKRRCGGLKRGRWFDAEIGRSPRGDRVPAGRVAAPADGRVRRAGGPTGARICAARGQHRLDPKPTPAEASKQDPHELRIAGKALRYTLEMAAVEGHSPGGRRQDVQTDAGAARRLARLRRARRPALRRSVEPSCRTTTPAAAERVIDLARRSFRRSAHELDGVRQAVGATGANSPRKIRAAFPLTRPRPSMPPRPNASGGRPPATAERPARRRLPNLQTDPGPSDSAAPAAPASRSAQARRQTLERRPLAVGVERADDGHAGPGGLEGVVVPHLAGEVEVCAPAAIASSSRSPQAPAQTAAARRVAVRRPGDQQVVEPSSRLIALDDVRPRRRLRRARRPGRCRALPAGPPACSGRTPAPRTGATAAGAGRPPRPSPAARPSRSAPPAPSPAGRSAPTAGFVPVLAEERARARRAEAAARSSSRSGRRRRRTSPRSPARRPPPARTSPACTGVAFASRDLQRPAAIGGQPERVGQHVVRPAVGDVQRRVRRVDRHAPADRVERQRAPARRRDARHAAA